MITIGKVRLKVLEIDKSETMVRDQKNDEINTSKIESMYTLGRCQNLYFALFRGQQAVVLNTYPSATQR
jgi:hypothetical protein